MTKQLIFGEITRQEAEGLAEPVAGRLPIGWNDPVPSELLIDAHPKTNPCVRVFGEGPAGETCANCAGLEKWHSSRVFYKCTWRPYSRGPGTDHRLRWPACSRFSRRKGEIAEHDVPK